MSSDIYIGMTHVLSHPGWYKLDAALNGDIEDCREAILPGHIFYNLEGDRVGPDWDYIQQQLTVSLMCSFYNSSWREVDLIEKGNGLVLHVSCGGSFRSWLLDKLVSYDAPFQVI